MWYLFVAFEKLDSSCYDFRELLYRDYASSDYFKILPSNFLRSVIPAWRLFEFVRWNDDDATTHDPLRMSVIKPNLSQSPQNRYSVSIYYLKNGWTEIYEIWHRRYANAYFLTSHIP